MPPGIVRVPNHSLNGGRQAAALPYSTPCLDANKSNLIFDLLNVEFDWYGQAILAWCSSLTRSHLSSSTVFPSSSQ